MNAFQTADSTPIGGYHGQYLKIDLSHVPSQDLDRDAEQDSPAIAAKPIPASVLQTFLGGSGLGVWILNNEGQALVDPLSAEAGIAFVFSPLVGSPITTSAKFAVVCKSPLTNRFNDALASSRFAISGKKTGFDAIYITGQAREPSVLLIDNGQVRLESAREVSGKSCSETETHLKQIYDDFQFAIIGPAAENKVRYATISHDRRHAGRGGSGAVLGAKNIKAIGVRGDRLVNWHSSDELLTLAKDLSNRSFGPATAKYRELGTATNMLVFNRLNALPTRNFQQSQFEGADQISPETLSVSRTKTRAYCASCTIGCEHIYEINSNQDGVRLEYENLFSMGSLCGVSDPEIVLQASQLCDELGLDTISTGGTIAFAMECVERGILDEPWLKFGDGNALLRAIRMIADRESIGNDMAEGSRRFAEVLGHNSIEFAPQVKGLEIPGYDPRTLQTMAIGFAVNARGADHNRSGAYEADFSNAVDRYNPSLESVRLAIESEDRSAIMDSLIICKFLRGIFQSFYDDAATMLRLTTGLPFTADELKHSAKKIIDAKKQFNIQAGWTPQEDDLPARFFATRERPDGVVEAGIQRDHFMKMIQAYNEGRGWSTDGWIT